MLYDAEFGNIENGSNTDKNYVWYNIYITISPKTFELGKEGLNRRSKANANCFSVPKKY